MNKKVLLIVAGVLLFFSVLLLEFVLVRQHFCPTSTETITPNDQTKDIPPKAMMLLIEFRNTDGLVNMVNDMKQRDIKGLLMVNADFVDKNSSVIKELLRTGVIEIAASYDPKPYWEMTYDEQYNTISDMVKRIEKTLDIKVRIISSRYMASDENTVKIADKLGIEYITARGTTELATTVYKPQEYNVKIISVSNIDVPEFKYGSFCDYSFYERSGSPEDMEREYQRAIQEDKFIGVSHTYIGGFKARWNEMWHKFWDSYEVDWVDLDTLGSVDKIMPMWQIPINKNAPYTPEKIRPAIPYEEEENVINPCQVEDLSDGSSDGIISLNSDKVVMFHNNTGPMCLDALDFLKKNGIAYDQYINTDSDYQEAFQLYKAEFTESEGVSETFGYYPMIFIKDRAFSGFNDDVGKEILELVK